MYDAIAPCASLRVYTAAIPDSLYAIREYVSRETTRGIRSIRIPAFANTYGALFPQEWTIAGTMLFFLLPRAGYSRENAGEGFLSCSSIGAARRGAEVSKFPRVQPLLDGGTQ